MTAVIVRPADWARDKQAIRSIREPVFVIEQQVDPALEWDDQEESAQHFLVIAGDTPVGTGRITQGGKIGRMAVLASERGKGYGHQLLEAICQYAAAHGFAAVYLHAQCHAEEFYRKAGFVPEGETFLEAGIQHIRMVRHFG